MPELPATWVGLGRRWSATALGAGNSVGMQQLDFQVICC